MGDKIAAAAHAREVLGKAAGFTVASHLTTMHYKRSEDLEHFREGLLRAGLPA